MSRVEKLRAFRVYRVYLDPLYMSRVEFIRTLSRFKKRKENSSSYVHVLHKTSHEEVLCLTVMLHETIHNDDS